MEPPAAEHTSSPVPNLPLPMHSLPRPHPHPPRPRSPWDPSVVGPSSCAACTEATPRKSIRLQAPRWKALLVLAVVGVSLGFRSDPQEASVTCPARIQLVVMATGSQFQSYTQGKRLTAGTIGFPILPGSETAYCSNKVLDGSHLRPISHIPTSSRRRYSPETPRRLANHLCRRLLAVLFSLEIPFERIKEQPIMRDREPAKSLCVRLCS
jgi:hypothetical protein